MSKAAVTLLSTPAALPPPVVASTIRHALAQMRKALTGMPPRRPQATGCPS